MAERIVLFDLDGTVLTFEGPPPGPGRTALEHAMWDLYAIERATDGIRVAGGTDRALARAMLSRARVHDDEAAIDRVLASYLARLQAIVQRRPYRPIGRVANTVRALRSAGVIVGIATGNIREGARIKLESAGLIEVFDLDRGGYGCDAEPRAGIVRRAADRCGAGPNAIVIVVGDTERDVQAGRAIGARVIGVASGPADRMELENAGADAIVDSCGDALLALALA